jgi:regulator of sigma E protease
MFLTIIVFILILSVLILVHEGGHLIVAKKNGLKVNEFAFGFPPRIFSFKKGGTRYSFNLIPIGGYVKEDSKNFSKATIGQRFKVLIAGVGMNIFLTIILLTIVSLFVYPWYQGIFMGIINTGYLLGLIFYYLGIILKDLLLTGRFAGDLVGPIGIAVLTSDMVSRGFLSVIYFVALLSLNLAIVNILPFPALDGGRLLFLAIEKFKGKPVSEKTEKIIHGTGLVILVVLMVIVGYRDVVRFILQ